jgi:GNAT superfamily N-acetyltransferase
MTVSFSLVDGPRFAAEASRILEEAWEPPVLQYTSAYLAWQLSFPSAVELPSVAAFAGRDPIGFAGATARRLRSGSTNLDAAVVSFVAVRPKWRGQGIASGLYRALLKALADFDVPVVTFGVPGSAGDKTLLRAYPEAGFQMQAMGTYSNYAFAYRQEKVNGDWIAHFSEDPGMLSSVAAQLSARDPSTLWSMPESGQLAHYLTDPRPRKLIVVEDASAEIRGAGFVVRSELRTIQGIERVTTLDSLWMSSVDASELWALLRLASAAWPSSAGSSPVVICPNLSGFEASALTAVGVRKTGAQFCAYFCMAGQKLWPKPERTNLEII